MAVFWLPQIVSAVGVDLILAGIHAQVKSLCGERLFLSQLTKIHKKKENNAFVFFLYNTIYSKLLFLSNYIRIYRSVYNTKRKKKVLQNLFICSEM